MNIRILDEYPPETIAMLQALYSRSSASVDAHIERVKAKGSASFMQSYYVGYGHASIGDCGNTTAFIENVSLLACKAVQNSNLYLGQETSTRYIDFSNNTPLDPVATGQSAAILEQWLAFYRRVVVDVRQQLRIAMRDQCDPTQLTSPANLEKAMDARAFDIARGFLPAGVVSQLSWNTSLRHAHEHLLRLAVHPLREVREIATNLRALLSQKYPSSFTHETPKDVIEYLRESAQQEEYFERPTGVNWSASTDIDPTSFDAGMDTRLQIRPKRAPLPKEFDRIGRIRFKFSLDFGSFRDLQRHRNGLCRMPLLTTSHGFHNWYFEQLSPALRQEAETFVEKQLIDIEKLKIDENIAAPTLQYYLPLGMVVPCELDYSLPQSIYVCELRSGATVHPTLRSVAHWMAAQVAEKVPMAKMYVDYSPDQFQLKRGQQDIVPIEDQLNQKS